MYFYFAVTNYKPQITAPTFETFQDCLHTQNFLKNPREIT